MPRKSSLYDLFMSYVQISDGCWLWLGVTDKDGYGRINIRGKTVRAHRLSWLVHEFEDPGRLNVLHHCDAPPCVRPDHLWLGTNADNMADKVRKARQSTGLVHATVRSGEEHWMHKRPDHRPWAGENHYTQHRQYDPITGRWVH